MKAGKIWGPTELIPQMVLEFHQLNLKGSKSEHEHQMERIHVESAARLSRLARWRTGWFDETQRLATLRK